MSDNMIGFKGSSNLDIGYFCCPYIPGEKRNAPDIGAQLYDQIHNVKTPTRMQLRIMEMVRNQTVTN